MILMFKRLIDRLLSSPKQAKPFVEETVGSSGLEQTESNAEIGITDSAFDTDTHEALIAFDESLLDNARTYWQVGDWKMLSEIEQDQLQHHPERAKLALLVAMGNQQTGNTTRAKELIRLSARWGCSKTIIAKVLVSGVHRNLGQASVMTGHFDADTRAIQHFTSAVSLGAVSGISNAFSLSKSYLQAAQVKLIEQTEFSANKLENFQGDFVKELPAAVISLVGEALNADDLHGMVEKIQHTHLNKYSINDQYGFYLMLADGIVTKSADRMTGLSYLQYVRRRFPIPSPAIGTALIDRYIAFGQEKLAVEMLTELTLKGVGPIRLSEKNQTIIQKANALLHEQAGKASEHGHDLLLGYLAKHLDQYRAIVAPRTPMLIEIGTTREDVPGQGSTLKLAQFCQQRGIDFVTVDMDPHNTRLAQESFQRMDAPNFRALTMKGEDFLRSHEGQFDFVFLDAYDFDHGKHSEQRQSRYEKYLGARIDEQQCHQMHLECAESIYKKMTLTGVVCVDDTWQEKGLWTAKGTLAMPYLIKNGFELIEARNRAAILRRAVIE
jgi:hypothetical protein